MLFCAIASVTLPTADPPIVFENVATSSDFLPAGTVTTAPYGGTPSIRAWTTCW